MNRTNFYTKETVDDTGELDFLYNPDKVRHDLSTTVL